MPWVRLPMKFHFEPGEVSRVTWPTRKELTQTTLMVFLMALTVAVFFFVIDEALGYFVRFVLGIGA